MQFKIYLVSYAAVHSLNQLTPSISGGNWVEVGTFPEQECAEIAKGLLFHDYGGLGPGSEMMIKVVCVPLGRER